MRRDKGYLGMDQSTWPFSGAQRAQWRARRASKESRGGVLRQRQLDLLQYSLVGAGDNGYDGTTRLQASGTATETKRGVSTSSVLRPAPLLALLARSSGCGRLTGQHKVSIAARKEGDPPAPPALRFLPAWTGSSSSSSSAAAAADGSTSQSGQNHSPGNGNVKGYADGRLRRRDGPSGTPCSGGLRQPAWKAPSHCEERSSTVSPTSSSSGTER